MPGQIGFSEDELTLEDPPGQSEPTQGPRGVGDRPPLCVESWLPALTNASVSNRHVKPHRLTYRIKLPDPLGQSEKATVSAAAKPQQESVAQSRSKRTRTATTKVKQLKQQQLLIGSDSEGQTAPADVVAPPAKRSKKYTEATVPEKSQEPSDHGGTPTAEKGGQKVPISRRSAPAKAARDAADPPPAGQRAVGRNFPTERVVQPVKAVSSAPFNKVSPKFEHIVELLVMFMALNWPNKKPTVAEDPSASALEKLVAYMGPLGFVRDRSGVGIADAPSAQRSMPRSQQGRTKAADREGQKQSSKVREKEHPSMDAQNGSQKAGAVIAKQKKEIEELKKQLEAQRQNEQEKVDAAVKKCKEGIAAEKEEEEKEARARQLLEDPVDEEEGDPKTCLEAMQVFEEEERNFCISLISQWLAPKWLVASKAGAIEECLFRFWSDWVPDPEEPAGVKQVVGQRYRVRAKQLSMKMCPIGLSPLTHRSPMSFVPRDPSDEQIDELIHSVEDYLLEAGEVRGKLWSGELDFASFVCDILIENDIVPNVMPPGFYDDVVDPDEARNTRAAEAVATQPAADAPRNAAGTAAMDAAADAARNEAGGVAPASAAAPPPTTGHAAGGVAPMRAAPPPAAEHVAGDAAPTRAAQQRPAGRAADDSAPAARAAAPSRPAGHSARDAAPIRSADPSRPAGNSTSNAAGAPLVTPHRLPDNSRRASGDETGPSHGYSDSARREAGRSSRGRWDSGPRESSGHRERSTHRDHSGYREHRDHSAPREHREHSGHREHRDHSAPRDHASHRDHSAPREHREPSNHREHASHREHRDHSSPRDYSTHRDHATHRDQPPHGDRCTRAPAAGTAAGSTAGGRSSVPPAPLPAPAARHSAGNAVPARPCAPGSAGGSASRHPSGSGAPDRATASAPERDFPPRLSTGAAAAPVHPRQPPPPPPPPPEDRLRSTSRDPSAGGS